MLTALISIFVLAGLAPLLCRLAGRHSGWLLALLPAGLTLYFATWIPRISGGGSEVLIYPWVPAAEVQMSFLIDGLSLLFALLILGIGTLVVLYAGSYLQGHPQLGRFFAVLLGFMGSMLGLVLSSNLVALFVFWELTSITSFLLIGFNHEDAESRRSALQGLFVTVGGGLALLAGFVLLALAGGSWELHELIGAPLTGHGQYGAILVLVLLGTFTKSAQVPFHFWLPNAMAAPTPVSAYLHSATMVKAGVYLLARLNPSLGGTEAWLLALGGFGAVTLITGAWMAYRSTSMKRMLAYSTVMALGTLTMLLGLGTPLAVTAACVFLLAHSLYKGALFLVAGILDHETGAKDLREMGGFARALPLTTAAALLAAASLAGLIPLFGFVAKEGLLEAALEAPWLATLFTVAAVAGAALTVGVAALVGLRPYFGASPGGDRSIHEAPWPLLAGPVLLAVLGVVFGLAPGLAEHGIIAAAAGAVAGEALVPGLSLWHGFNAALGLSALSLAAGAALAWGWVRLRPWLERSEGLDALGPERAYDVVMAGVVWLADWQTRVLQSGYLRHYVFTTLAVVLALGGYTLARAMPLSMAPIVAAWPVAVVTLVFIVAFAALVTVVKRSSLGAVAALGAVGFGVAMLYVFFSAPDLAITQVLVETLTVILLVLVLFRLPRLRRFSRPLSRARDAVLALGVGGLMTLLLLVALEGRFQDSISAWHIANSVPAAYGRNVVNVILVDFRALDTLGEIFVLSLAAIGVYAMLNWRRGSR